MNKSFIYIGVALLIGTGAWYYFKIKNNDIQTPLSDNHSKAKQLAIQVQDLRLELQKLNTMSLLDYDKQYHNSFWKTDTEMLQKLKDKTIGELSLKQSNLINQIEKLGFKEIYGGVTQIN